MSHRDGCLGGAGMGYGGGLMGGADVCCYEQSPPSNLRIWPLFGNTVIADVTR